MEIFTIPTLVNGVTNKASSKTLPSNCNVNNTEIKLLINNLMTSIKEQNTCIQASDSAHRVILCGDSHMKGFSKSIQSLLCSDFKLFTVVKLGSSTSALSESMVETANLQ